MFGEKTEESKNERAADEDIKNCTHSIFVETAVNSRRFCCKQSRFPYFLLKPAAYSFLKPIQGNFQHFLSKSAARFPPGTRDEGR